MADQPVGEIIRTISDDLKVLVRDEVQLAKSELVPAAKSAGIGGGLLAAAGYFAICAAGLLYFCVVYVLVRLGLQPWLSFLIVGGALLLLAGLLALIGLAMLKKVKPPKRTITQATETINQLKGSVQQSLAAIKGSSVKKALKR